MRPISGYAERGFGVSPTKLTDRTGSTCSHAMKSCSHEGKKSSSGFRALQLPPPLPQTGQTKPCRPDFETIPGKPPPKRSVFALLFLFKRKRRTHSHSSSWLRAMTTAMHHHNNSNNSNNHSLSPRLWWWNSTPPIPPSLTSSPSCPARHSP